MSTKDESRLRKAVRKVLGPEIERVQRAAKMLADRDERGRFIAGQARSALSLRGESPEEVQAIQNRNAVRSAGVGALLAWVASTDMVKNSELVKKHWWLLPVAVLVVGWLAKNRGFKDAPAILTFGGVLLVQAYQKHREDEDAKKEAPKANATTQTAGFDTGALAGSYAWLQDGSGQWVKVMFPSGLAAALPAYEQRSRALPANTNTAGPTQEDYEAAQQLAAAAFSAV